MTEEERQAQRRGDEIDDIDTTDLERSATDKESTDEDEPPFDTYFLIENRINLARAFLGKDGGYSIRKLKKFFK